MVAYPTTLIFRVARTIERALADIKAGKPRGNGDGVNFADFKDITNYDEWARIEDKYNAPSGGMRMSGTDAIAAFALALRWPPRRPAPARRPRCGSRSAASRRCSICR